MDRETPEEAELMRARRRERDRCSRQAQTAEQGELQDDKMTDTGETTYQQSKAN